MINRIFLLSCLCWVSCVSDNSISSAQDVKTEGALAFPGADGFGKYTTGGRGGKVYVVSNLNDDGPGSLREAILKKETRIIVFAVSGTIALKSALNISSPNVTIAGQSAPGDGICIRNYPVKIIADNVIVRFIRFRLGDEARQQEDSFSGNSRNKNIIIDHCSMSWAVDECASFYRNKNFTLQWCIISESLNHSVHEKGDHGYGGIWGGEGATFHHNLLASHTSRLPRFSGSSTTPNSPEELVDFTNNVIYNWEGNSTYGGEKGRYNMVGNYYKPGPATKSSRPWMLNPFSPVGKFFLYGNYFFKDDVITKNNWRGVKFDHPDSARATVPFTVTFLPQQSAADAFEEVLKYAGASYRRDPIDSRIVDEVRSGKSVKGKKRNGIIDSQREVGGWPELKQLTPLADADQDGMPDDWETKNHLDPKDAGDAGRFDLSKGYSNIEVYLNELVKQ
ncbi:pectate lyase [Cytophagales bacterium WSM2-2]|nr:pectate lyase [Cytophagales bacterium WSM2-2]